MGEKFQRETEDIKNRTESMGSRKNQYEDRVSDLEDLAVVNG